MNSSNKTGRNLIAFRIIPLIIVFGVLSSCAQFYLPGSSAPVQDESETTVEPEVTARNEAIQREINEEIARQEAAEALAEELIVPETIEPEPEISQAIQVPELEVFIRMDTGPDTNNTQDLSEETSISTGEDESWRLQAETESQKQSVFSFCQEVGGKLGSVDVEDCLLQELRYAGLYTAHNRPMAVRDFMPEGSVEGKTRVLIIGGIHGDEYSSISIMFKWMALLNEGPMPNFFWRFAPSVNPDGLLGGTAIRQNSNGVDLNRNFPSKDWDAEAQKYWKESTGSNPRRYPGEFASSELEVQWIVNQIETFKPDVIMSVHAPYHLLDFDGPSEPPARIGELYLHVLGVYPGSLGNYAGIDLEMPVVTLELPAAGIMPDDAQIKSMWSDIKTWLRQRPSETSF